MTNNLISKGVEMKGYLGNKAKETDIRDKIPYMLNVSWNGKILKGCVKGRLLTFPVISLRSSEHEVSIQALIRNWETGNPIKLD